MVDVSRIWSQTETARATIALERQGLKFYAVELERSIDILFARHITPASPGMWIDKIDAQGGQLSESVPASILYHLVGAFDAYLAHRDVTDADA